MEINTKDQLDEFTHKLLDLAEHYGTFLHGNDIVSRMVILATSLTLNASHSELDGIKIIQEAILDGILHYEKNAR